MLVMPTAGPLATISGLSRVTTAPLVFVQMCTSRWNTFVPAVFSTIDISPPSMISPVLMWRALTSDGRYISSWWPIARAIRYEVVVDTFPDAHGPADPDDCANAEAAMPNGSNAIAKTNRRVRIITSRLEGFP